MAILTYPEGNNLRGKGLTWMDRPVLSINNQVVQQILGTYSKAAFFKAAQNAQRKEEKKTISRQDFWM